MNRLRQVAVALLLLLFLAGAGPTVAAEVDIAIPLQQSGHADLAKAIRHALLQFDPSLRVNIIAVDPNNPAAGRRAELLITVGEQLLAWAAGGNGYAATLCFYVHAASFDQLPRDEQVVTALYREQPLTRQLRLAQLLLPQLTHLALIYRGGYPPPQLAQLPTQPSLILTALDVDDRNDWIKAVSDLMAGHQALLAVDDPQLYNRNTVRSILLTAYRHGRVLIGPNRPFVTAGSLASTYTTSDQYLAQLVRMAAGYLEQGELPAPQYPHQFQVAINYQVAASLGLQLPDEKSVADQLRQGEAR